MPLEICFRWHARLQKCVALNSGFQEAKCDRCGCNFFSDVRVPKLSGTVILPAGKYYIGDPCYIFNNTSWGELLDKTKYFACAENTFKGKKLFVANTAYGDGCYPGSNGFGYGVDAGVIGAVPFELIDVPEGLELGTVLEVTHELECKCENGDFTFHSEQDTMLLREEINLSIITSDELDEELEDEELEDEELEDDGN